METPGVRPETRARLPTRYGEFEIQVYADSRAEAQHVALTRGRLTGDPPVLVRVHSECLTGDVLSSLRCDCGSQLELALKAIAAEGRGVLVYLRQEGRGIGLYNKVRAYALQDGGLDTVEANERLGFPADLRDYELAGRILRGLGVRRLRLLTNNPAKLRGLQKHGLEVVERLPLVVDPNHENGDYLETKRRKLGHLLAKATRKPA